MEQKLLKIIQRYGVNHQLRKFNEECFELEEAIINYMNYEDYLPDADEDYKKYLKEHITEELADVCVMLHQFKLYYDIKPYEIYRVMEQKIERQLTRMEEE